MASVLALFLLALVSLIAPTTSSIDNDVTFDRVPCGRCVNPPCGRCGLTLIRGAQQARQPTTARPASTERPTRRTSSTRRPTRTSTTRRPTRPPTTPRKPVGELACEEALVMADRRVFCSRDQFACPDYHTCVPDCRRSTAEFWQ